MNHFYQDSKFGEDYFTYPNLYREFVQILQNDSIFVEIGSWKGRSISFFAVEAINAEKDIKCFCVDTWRGSAEHAQEVNVLNDTLHSLFLNNIEPVAHFITPIRKPSVEAAADFQDESVDIVFIDGDHDYQPVKDDIAAWLPKVKNGGLITGHDYLLPSVKKAVDEVFGDAVLFRDPMENCWIVRVQVEST